MTARQPASGANDHAAERDAHTLRAERVAVSVGFGIIALLLFCQALAMSETVAVLSPRTAWAILFAAIPILVFGLLAFTARPVRLRATLRHARASRRWADHRCPGCSHPMPPQRFDGPCPECGEAFRPPSLPTTHRDRGVRHLVIAVATAALVSLAWLAADRASFDAEVAVNPSVRHARPRWWPARNAGFVHLPGSGVTAHD